MKVRMKSVWEDHMYTRKELMINSKCLPQSTIDCDISGHNLATQSVIGGPVPLGT